MASASRVALTGPRASSRSARARCRGPVVHCHDRVVDRRDGRVEVPARRPLRPQGLLGVGPLGTEVSRPARSVAASPGEPISPRPPSASLMASSSSGESSSSPSPAGPAWRTGGPSRDGDRGQHDARSASASSSAIDVDWRPDMLPVGVVADQRAVGDRAVQPVLRRRHRCSSPAATSSTYSCSTSNWCRSEAAWATRSCRRLAQHGPLLGAQPSSRKARNTVTSSAITATAPAAIATIRRARQVVHRSKDRPRPGGRGGPTGR